ncbi:CsbD-like [Lentzea fradiae]|uniref:CsbD-like n=1 Tax=Lentzea fradiae TaxID=200378 RepID=A0A1G8CX22_9PSEU|nr:CsbD family protein [Lentzea fradiae]SDH50107.1 CsbD-like [Lentzea fradiae]
MGLSDKIGNKAEELGGKAKEAAGEATGDEQLAGEGRADQAKAALKDGVEKVKDVVGDVVDNVAKHLKK